MLLLMHEPLRVSGSFFPTKPAKPYTFRVPQSFHIKNRFSRIPDKTSKNDCCSTRLILMTFLFDFLAKMKTAAERLQNKRQSRAVRGGFQGKKFRDLIGFRATGKGLSPIGNEANQTNFSNQSEAKPQHSFAFAGATGVDRPGDLGSAFGNQLGKEAAKRLALTNSADLELAITRPSKIRRSESFKTHFREWRRSQACQATLQIMRADYEKTFFQESSHGCKSTREELFQQIIFSPTPANDSLRQYFLLDLSLEAAQSVGLKVLSSQSEKYVIPGQGLVVIQRYCLGRKLEIIGQIRGWWSGKTHGAVLQMTIPSERPAELKFRLHHDLAQRMGISMAGIMQDFFGKLGPALEVNPGPRGTPKRKSIV